MCSELFLAFIYFITIIIVNFLLLKLIKTNFQNFYFLYKIRNIFISFKYENNKINFYNFLNLMQKNYKNYKLIQKNLNVTDLLILSSTFSYLLNEEKKKSTPSNSLKEKLIYFKLMEMQYLFKSDITITN